jgi:hypothetical protein
VIAIAGLLGSWRWCTVGDASVQEASLAAAGFSCLLLVTAFELEVSPEKFLSEKLLATSWLIDKLTDTLSMEHRLPFPLPSTTQSLQSKPSSNLLHFIRSSPAIYYLYEEDYHILHQRKRYRGISKAYYYYQYWHMLAAVGYLILVSTAVGLNDNAESKVGYITGGTFTLFCMLAYITGEYMYLPRFMRGWIMPWNPFLR